MKATLSLLLLLAATGSATAAVSTANRTLLFNDDFDVLSASQSGIGTQWNYIDYVGWENTSKNNWRTYQSNDTTLTQIRTEGDLSFVTLWGKKGSYHTENTSTSNANAIVRDDVYACGGLFTNKTFNFQYGYVEVRARFDSVKGCWPAIWMMPTDGSDWPKNGEIDIMEHLNYESKVYQTLHLYNDNRTGDVNPAPGVNNGTGTSIVNSTGGTNDWHTYGMEWQADAISFYVDGKLTGTITGDAYANWPFGQENNTFYLMIDQQIGGDWPGMPNATADATLSTTGAAFDIDYVRVYSAESTDSNVWKNGSEARWEAGVQLADGRSWQNGANMNFEGTAAAIEVGDISGSYITAKGHAAVQLNKGTIAAADGGLHIAAKDTSSLVIGSRILNDEGMTLSVATDAHLELAGEVTGNGPVSIDSGATLVSGSLTTASLTLLGDAAATKAGSGTHLNVSGELTVGTLTTAANQWYSPVHLTVEDGGSATVTQVQGTMVNGKIGQVYLSALGSGALNIGTLSNAGGVVNINSNTADAGRVSISGNAAFYQLQLHGGELELHSTKTTTNDAIYLKGGTLIWDGELGDNRLRYEGGTVRLATAPAGDITLTGNQKVEIATLGTQATSLAEGTSLATTEDWTIGSSTQLSGGGTLEVAAGTVTLNKQLTNDNMVAGIRVKDGATMNVVAINPNGNYTGTLTIDEGGTVRVSGNTANNIVPICGSAGSIVNNGELIVDAGNTSTGNKWINGLSGTGKVQVECANVRLASTKETFTGSVEVGNNGSATLAGNAHAFDTLNISDGTLTISTADALTARELRLGAGSLLDTKGSKGEACITLGSGLYAVEGAHLNADIVLAEGAVLNISGSGDSGEGLVMGSAITFGGRIELGGDVVNALIDGAEVYVLATSMDGFTFNGLTYNDSFTASAAEVFTLSSADSSRLNLADYELSYTCATAGEGRLALAYVAPEPTTATLSLLALAALCARHRRH